MKDKNRSPCILLESAVAPAGSRFSERRQGGIKLYTEKTGEGDATISRTMARVEVATVDIINRNGRYYSRAVYEAANAAAQADLSAGRLWGLLEHPDFWNDGDKGRLEMIALKYESLGIEGNTVVATAVVVEAPAGQTFKALSDAGVEVGVSTNGYGSAKYLAAKEIDPSYPYPDQLIAVVQDDFRYLTIDLVSDPSNPGGKATTESTGQEGFMPEWLKKLLAKTGMTEAQLKVEFPELAQMLEGQNNIAALTQRIQELTDQLAAEQSARAADVARVAEGARRLIVTSMLEGVELPQLGVVGDLDLDAQFRSALDAAAIKAESDEAARVAVKKILDERQIKTKEGAVNNPGIPPKNKTEGRKASGFSAARGQFGL